MAKKYIAIDIGIYNTKMCNVRVKRKSVEFEKPVIMRTPDFSTQNDRLIDLKGLSKLFKTNMPLKRAKKAVIIFNENLAVTKSLTIPSSSPKKMMKMIKMSAGQYLPSNIDSYIIRYKILELGVDSKHILVVSMKKFLSEQLYKVFRKAGLKVVVFDSGINCMIKYMERLYNAGIEKMENATCIIDFGASSIKLTVMSKGRTLYFQILNQSSRKIDLMIANELDVDSEKAEKYKIDVGLENTYDEKEMEAESVQSIIKTQVDLMLNDIYKQLQNISTKHDVHIEKILITGGMSRMKGICRHINQGFEIPCELVSSNNVFKFTPKERLRYSNIEYFFPLCTNIAGAVIRR